MLNLLKRFCYKPVEGVKDTYYKIIYNTIIIVMISNENNKVSFSQRFIGADGKIHAWSEEVFELVDTWTLADIAQIECSIVRDGKIGGFEDLDKIIPDISLVERMTDILNK